MTLDEVIKYAEKVVELANMQAGFEFSNTERNQCKKFAEEHRQLAEWLKELKQLREQTKWIPVSERLPEIADVYRVTRYYPNNIMNPKYIVDACCFDGSNNWYNDNRINHERSYADNVIAWQENPEPYKAESE